MPQKNNSIKTLGAIAGLVIAVLTIGAAVYAQFDSTAKIDSAITTHDTCETAHPGIRSAIKTNTQVVTEVKYTVDSMRIEQRHFQKQVNTDLKEIKALLKKINGNSP